jgi:hypothetical protein
MKICSFKTFALFLLVWHRNCNNLENEMDKFIVKGNDSYLYVTIYDSA